MSLRQTVQASQQKRRRSNVNISNYKIVKSKAMQKKFISENPELVKTREINRRIDREKEKLKDLSVEDYFTQYEKIPSDLKQYFESPNEIKKSSEYKDYIARKNAYLTQLAEYNRKVRKYNAWKYGYKLGLKRQLDPNMTKEERAGWKAGMRAMRGAEEKAELRKLG